MLSSCSAGSASAASAFPAAAASAAAVCSRESSSDASRLCRTICGCKDLHCCGTVVRCNTMLRMAFTGAQDYCRAVRCSAVHYFAGLLRQPRPRATYLAHFVRDLDTAIGTAACLKWAPNDAPCNARCADHHNLGVRCNAQHLLPKKMYPDRLTATTLPANTCRYRRPTQQHAHDATFGTASLCL